MSDLLLNLACLIRSDMRDSALAQLVNVIGQDGIDRLSVALGEKRYTHRHDGLGSARASSVLSDYAQKHEWSPTSPHRAIDYIRHYQKINNVFSYENLHSKIVLDYGCGVHNPLTMAILLYLNGAKKVVASDPGEIDSELFALSSREFCVAFLSDPEKFSFSGVDSNEMMQRFSMLDWKNLMSGRVGCSSNIIFNSGPLSSIQNMFIEKFGVVLSTTVLEHVENLPTELALINSMSERDCVHIHRIDLTDHRHFLQPYHPFEFMRTGLYKGLNGMRRSDFLREFHRAGLSIIYEEIARYPLTPQFINEIRDEWKVYENNELDITIIGVSLQRC